MTRNPFTPTFDALPTTIPIFPLPEAILLPREDLPLNIFEPRYLNMTFDALRADRMIGMIQPDASPYKIAKDAIYKTGCAGRITTFAETEDGRLLINLTGICRFDINEEISTIRGYRRVVPNWHRYKQDMDDVDTTRIDSENLLTTMDKFFKLKNIEADWEALKKLSGCSLINILAMNLPFNVEDKQALIEAVTVSERKEVLVTLTQMSLSEQDGQTTTRH